MMRQPMKKLTLLVSTIDRMNELLLEAWANGV